MIDDRRQQLGTVPRDGDATDAGWLGSMFIAGGRAVRAFLADPAYGQRAARLKGAGG
jgi:hypothetical protein